MIKVKVNITNEQKDYTVDTSLRSLIRKTVKTVLTCEGIEENSEVNVLFVSDEKIKTLNKEFRNKNKVTDVLSFPLSEDGEYDLNPETGNIMLGDVVICPKRAYEQSQEFGHSFEREVSYLTAHSILHLLGYDHMVKIEKTIMRQKEKEIMKAMGLNIKTE